MNFGHKKRYIDSNLTEASNGASFDIICPGDETKVESITWATREDTESVLQSAQKGFEYWSHLPLKERLHWMKKLRDKLLENRNVGIPLCESKIPRMVTMIGSTETAQKLIQQSSKTSIKRYSMECRCNAPFIVFNDADLDLAISHGAALKIGNSGQICVAPNRFFIHESVIEAFTAGLKQKFVDAKVGFGRENEPDMGPPANKQSVDKMHQIVKDVIDQGGILIIGGSLMPGAGYYFPLTIVQMNNQKAKILQEEIFGPVAMLVPFFTREEVLELANNTDAGLASYVYSINEKTLDFLVDHLAFGEVHLNGLKFDIYLPHGGIKNNGIGEDCSTFALDDYLIRKRVTQALS